LIALAGFEAPKAQVHEFAHCRSECGHFGFTPSLQPVISAPQKVSLYKLLNPSAPFYRPSGHSKVAGIPLNRLFNFSVSPLSNRIQFKLNYYCITDRLYE